MNPPELPSISIILTGHNEEYCIGDAIRSVFGQDYEGPVEIILSDDGSSDGTFAVMQEMAAEYRGPHRVVLNRSGRGPGDQASRGDFLLHCPLRRQYDDQEKRLPMGALPADDGQF